MSGLPANFSSQFLYFKLRNGDKWFSSLPVISITAQNSISDLTGTYSITFPNPRGIAENLFTLFANQELWFAHIPTRTMYRFMAGQPNGFNPQKNTTFVVNGRGLNGLLTDNKVSDSWINMRGDFIVCDPTFGAVPTVLNAKNTVVTTWHAFTDDFDRFDYWEPARWGAQPAWVQIIDGELELQGDGSSTLTVEDTNSYAFETLEFRAKVDSPSNSMKFGFTLADRSQYVQFSLNASNVTCEVQDGASYQKTATPDSISQTNYNYYRIEWDNQEARFFVNGVLEVTQTLNVPAGTLVPFFESAGSAQLLTLEYMKAIILTIKQASYVANSQLLTDLIQNICQIGYSTNNFVYYVDDDFDLHAVPYAAIPSGYAYGYNSSLYTTPAEAVLSVELNAEAKDLYNFIRVLGGETLITVSAGWVDQFKGDGTTTSFPLGYKAQKPLTLVQVNGSTLTENTDFSVTYADVTIIKFNTPPGNTQSINLLYNYFLPIIATAANNASIAALKVTREYDVTDTNITSVNRAQLYANALLAYYSDPRTVITLVIPLDPRLKLGTTVQVDAPFYGISNTTYQIIQMQLDMAGGKWTSTLTLGNSEITTSAEIIRLILQQLDQLQSLTQTNQSVVNTVNIGEGMASHEGLTATLNYIEDSFIAGSPLDNSVAGRGQILDDFEGGVAAWVGAGTHPASDGTLHRVGALSMKLPPGSASFSVATTQSYGDLSAYTLVASGSPASGTVGLWVYLTSATDLTAITMRLGSDSSNYTQVTGIRTFGGFYTAPGWNYFVFPLSTGATTGNPNWTAVAYQQFAFTGVSGDTIWVDYDTIGKGNNIALNGAGYRPFAYSVTVEA